MIFDARSSSRRWTTVHTDAKFVRKMASSMAESPPPTTAMSLVAEEEAIAGGAGGDAVAEQALLRLEAEHPGLAPVETMSDRARYSVFAHPDAEGADGHVDAVDVGGEELGAEAGRLLAELLHELGAHDARRGSRGSSRRRW